MAARWEDLAPDLRASVVEAMRRTAGTIEKLAVETLDLQAADIYRAAADYLAASPRSASEEH